MTGDIQSKLLNSDAALSLAMEARIAQAFANAGWPANQSMYYTDPATGKIREIDVHVRKNFSRTLNRSRRGIRTDVHFFCECKSLKDQHIILRNTNIGQFWSDAFEYLWAGHPEQVRQVVDRLIALFKIGDPAVAHKLRGYIEDRAYPAPDGRELMYRCRNTPLPEVDILSRTFRETNSVKVREEDSSVIWHTILALSSAIGTAKKLAVERSLEWIFGSEEYPLLGVDKPDNIASAIDYEILDLSLYHAVIFIRGSLWNLTDGGLEKVGSARLVVGNLDFSMVAVDIVAEESADEYVARATRHVEQHIRKAFKQTHQRLKRCKWTSEEHEGFVKIIMPAAHRKGRNKVIRKRET